MSGIRRGATMLALACAFLLASATAAAGAPASSASTAPEPPRVQRTYEIDTTTLIVNPERGWFDEGGTLASITAEKVAAVRSSGASTLHLDIDLSPYVGGLLTPEQLQAETTALSAAFAAMRTGGVKAIVRFTYSPSGTKDCGSKHPNPQHPLPDIPSDAPVDIILQHIAQFAPAMRADADVISNFEAGFLGAWGEWHCSSYNQEPDEPPNQNGVPLDETAMKKVVHAMIRDFPPKQIAVRYPRYILQLFPDTYTDPTSVIGNHQDCYASTTPDDAGTWTPGQEARQKAEMGELGRDHVVTATVCLADPQRATCEIANREMHEMHFSYLQKDFYLPGLELYGAPAKDVPASGCWDEIGRSLGYRLALTASDLPATLVPGRTEHLSFTIENTGWASMFNPRPVFVVLRSAERLVSLPVEVDPRAWKSRSAHTFTASLDLPADLPEGEYDIALWLPDAAENLRPSPAFSVRLANVDMWDETSGLNVVAQNVAVLGPPEPARLADSGTNGPSPLLVPLAGASLAAGAAALVWRRRIVRHTPEP